MKEKAQVKESLDKALADELEPGEAVEASTEAMIGSALFGPTSMIAKWTYFAVTPERVIVLGESRFSRRVKGVWFIDRRADVKVTPAEPRGKFWATFEYTRPEGTKLKVNVHQYWKDDLDKVLAALAG